MESIKETVNNTIVHIYITFFEHRLFQFLELKYLLKLVKDIIKCI